MSGRISTPLPFLKGKIVLEGMGWQGQPIRITFPVSQSMDSSAVQVVEEWDDQVLLAGGEPVDVIKEDRHFRLEVDMRLLKDEEERVWTLEILKSYNFTCKHWSETKKFPSEEARAEFVRKHVEHYGNVDHVIKYFEEEPGA